MGDLSLVWQKRWPWPALDRGGQFIEVNSFQQLFRDFNYWTINRGWPLIRG